MSETPTLKEAIVQYVNKFEVVSFIILYDLLEESYPNVNAGEKLKCLSELVMANQLKRYDYYLTDRAEARTFFMPGESKIHF